MQEKTHWEGAQIADANLTLFGNLQTWEIQHESFKRQLRIHVSI